MSEVRIASELLVLGDPADARRVLTRLLDRVGYDADVLLDEYRLYDAFREDDIASRQNGARTYAHTVACLLTALGTEAAAAKWIEGCFDPPHPCARLRGHRARARVFTLITDARAATPRPARARRRAAPRRAAAAA